MTPKDHLLIALLVLACAVLPARPVTAAGYTYRVLYTFCSQSNCADGQSPSATLLMDQAGNLYGTAGGDGGSVFRLTPGRHHKWKFETLYDFCAQSNCAGSNTPLIIDATGKLYGTTGPTGANDGGSIFQLKPNASGKKWKYKLLYTFPCSDGACPNGQHPSGLTYLGAASGEPYDGTSALFGTAKAGGNGLFPLGVAFRLEPQSTRWKQTVLYSFCSATDCTDGYTPNAPVVDDAGRLWGTTSAGGNGRGGGVLYSIGGRHESVEYEFCSDTEDCLDGSFPTTPVLLDKSGRIVGTTPLGGTFGIPNGPGTLFAVSGGNEQVLYNFCSKAHCADGLHPSAGVIEDASGNIFGVTAEGGDGNDGGVAFEFQSGTLQVLHKFGSAAGGADGCTPLGGLIMDEVGNLYGTTSGCGAGSAGDGGTVFELSPK
ncbi:MAG TPA: choice-of-anchor tandem repeat GloVer-containing protein [Rhizomicrobium sp.]|nr:choice-of-anchor tandem repeat GloVer-containing protein [Rhizomicrobium sp.]